MSLAIYKSFIDILLCEEAGETSVLLFNLGIGQYVTQTHATIISGSAIVSRGNRLGDNDRQMSGDNAYLLPTSAKLAS